MIHPRRREAALAAVLVVTLLATGATACAERATGHSLIGDPSPVGAQPGTPPDPGAGGERAATSVPGSGPSGTPTSGALAPGTVTGSAPGPGGTGPGAGTAAPGPGSPGGGTPTVGTGPAARPPRPYAVGSTSLDLTDTTRTTAGSPGRHLPTLVLYPAVGTAGASETAGGAGVSGPWPLVVFAHGYNVTPLTYHDLLHHLAEAGFVVVAPSFPLETQGGALDENDLQNEPADIRFVITEALAAGARTGILNGMVDSAHIALAGHSDGGEAVLGAAYLPGVADPRVGPVIAMAAQGILDGNRLPPSPRHPLLVVQGTVDTINPPARGDHLYASVGSPKAYLQLLGAGHLPPVADANRWRPVVEATIVDWLDAWFGGPNGQSAAGRLGHDGNVGGIAQFQLG